MLKGMRSPEDYFGRKAKLQQSFLQVKAAGPGAAALGGSPSGVGGVDHGSPGGARPHDRQLASTQVGRVPLALLWVPMARPPGPIKATQLWSEPFAWAS